MATLNINTYPNGYVPTIDEWNNDIFGAIETRVNDVTYDQVSASLSIDEDTMVSDSATKLPTQQSVKAYVDAKTGGGGGGSTSDVLEVLNEIEKSVGSPLGFTAKLSMNNSFTYDDNLLATLSAGAAAGATSISMSFTSPIQTSQLIPEEMQYYIYDKANGSFESFSVASAIAGNTYALNSALANSYLSASTVIGRNFGNVNTGARQFEFSTISAASGLSANYYNERIELPDGAVLKTANVQAKFNTETWFKVTTVATASKQITVNLDSLSARLAEIATATANDGNVMWFYKMVFNGNEYFQYGDGKRVTVTGTSYSAPNGTLTVSEDFTSAEIGAPSSDQNTVYYGVLEAVKINNAYGEAGTPESFSTVIPTRIKAYDVGIAYPSYVHSHWKMNGTGNEINSKQPGGTYDLTQVGTVPSTVGKLGNCRGVYSASNYFQWGAGGSSSTVYDTKVFAVGCWVKVNGTASEEQCIIEKRDQGGGGFGWKLSVGESGVQTTKINFGFPGVAGIVTGADITTNLWTYVFACNRATSGANEMRIYLNGALSVQGSGATFTATTYDLRVGLRSYSVGYPASTTLIDSIEYWNTVPATWAEIEAIIAQRYASGLGREYGLNIGHSLVAQKSNITTAAGGYNTTQYKLIRNVTSGQGFYNSLLATQTNLV